MYGESGAKYTLICMDLLYIYKIMCIFHHYHAKYKGKILGLILHCKMFAPQTNHRRNRFYKQKQKLSGRSGANYTLTGIEVMYLYKLMRILYHKVQ